MAEQKKQVKHLDLTAHAELSLKELLERLLFPREPVKEETKNDNNG